MLGKPPRWFAPVPGYAAPSQTRMISPRRARRTRRLKPARNKMGELNKMNDGRDMGAAKKGGKTMRQRGERRCESPNSNPRNSSGITTQTERPTRRKVKSQNGYRSFRRVGSLQCLVRPFSWGTLLRGSGSCDLSDAPSHHSRCNRREIIFAAGRASWPRRHEKNECEDGDG